MRVTAIVERYARTGAVAIAIMAGFCGLHAGAMEIKTCGDQVILSGRVVAEDYRRVADILSTHPEIRVAVLRAAQHTDTVLASDGAGGYCWPDFAVSFDAIFTTVRVLELLAHHESERVTS